MKSNRILFKTDGLAIEANIEIPENYDLATQPANSLIEGELTPEHQLKDIISALIITLNRQNEEMRDEAIVALSSIHYKLKPDDYGKDKIEICTLSMASYFNADIGQLIFKIAQDELIPYTMIEIKQGEIKENFAIGTSTNKLIPVTELAKNIPKVATKLSGSLNGIVEPLEILRDMADPNELKKSLKKWVALSLTGLETGQAHPVPHIGFLATMYIQLKGTENVVISNTEPLVIDVLELAELAGLEEPPRNFMENCIKRSEEREIQRNDQPTTAELNDNFDHLTTDWVTATLEELSKDEPNLDSTEILKSLSIKFHHLDDNRKEHNNALKFVLESILAARNGAEVKTDDK